MSSRGSVARYGNIPNKDYYTDKITENGVKILKGLRNNHSLPEIAHTPNSIYAKLKDDGVTLHEMRFFDEKGYPFIEMAYHPEPKINNGDRETDILHFHYFDGLTRLPAKRMDLYKEIKEKYKKYLEEFDLYD